jgi:hypothetical protein
MTQPDPDLKRLERSTFRAVADSGLWDILLASVVAMFAVAPVLSSRLGDFWSSAVFLPVWAAVYVAIRVVQDRVVRPRVGSVRFAPARRRRLAWLTAIMLVVNLVALVVGIVAAIRAPAGQLWLFPIAFSLMLLVGFTLGAVVLQIPRLLLYGLLLGVAPAAGEVLWRRGLASHHGFPLVFGVCAAVILAIGVLRFVRFLPPRPDAADGSAPEPTHE